MPVFQDYQPQVPLDIGSTPQVRTGGEAIGQGLQNLGQGLGEAAIGIAHYAKVQQQKDQYQTAVNTDLFKAQQTGAFQTGLQNAPATGDGFHQSTLDNYDKAAADYIKSVSPDQQQRVSGELAEYRATLSNQSAAKEHEIGNAYVLGTLKDSYNSSLNAVARDPNTRATVQQGLFDRIDQAYYLEPAQREDLKRSFTNGLEFQQVKSIAPADPAAVRQLQGMPTPTTAAPTTTDGVWQNMLHAENASANPSATSGKGAQGVAQVMPDTARQVAAGMGMQDVAKMSNSQLQAYFTAHPDVNAKIGRTYFDQQMTKYGNDPQAAVIAYNAGPAVADKWIASGRNDNVLPKETQDYKSEVLGYNPNSGDIPTGGPARGTAVSQNNPDIAARPGGSRFNYANVQNMGDPRAAGWVDNNITTVQAGGQNWQVNKQAAPAFQGFLNDLAAEGYNLKSSGGFNYRPIRGGDGSQLSQHAWGNAIDIDAPNNAQGGTKTNLPANVRELAQKWGLSWGMDIKGRPDPMHFEWAGPNGAQGGQVGTQPAPTPDPRFSSLTPEQWDSLYNGARTEQNQNQAITRGQLEPVVQDASAALMTNGRYDGQMPTPQQFSQAYGPVEGAQKYSQFQQIQQVGKEIDGYKSMTPDQIASDVEAAKPVGSGDGFAMAQSRYEAVQKAAATTLAMRKADPAKYVQTTSPGVAAQWQNANTPDGYRTALSSMAAAQSQLGIAPQDQKLLPDDFAQKVVTQYKNDAAPFAQRVAAVTNTILRTQDQSQQQVIFQQLVKAGLPPTTEGAIEAYARGDQGAGERLMTAATTDFSKLPAASEDKIKKVDLDNAIATQVMAPDQIGGIAYGVRYGGPDNIARAQNGADLMQRAVRMRMAQGETDVNKAVTDVSKDMFGTDNQVYNSTINGMNMAAAIPTGYNLGVLYRGVAAMRPQLENSITQSMQALNDKIAGGDPTKIAVLNAQTKNQVNNIIQNGEITNYGSNGFAFIDPYTNKAVPGPDGKPLVFTLGDVEKADSLNTDYGTQPATGQPAQPAPSVQGAAPALSSAAPAPQPSGNVPNIPVTPQRTSNVPTSGADAFNKAKQQFTPQDAAGAAQIFPGGL